MKGFRTFVLRGNVIDLAVGIVVGVAFGALITGFVKDLITPLIAAIGGKPDFSGLTFTINNSKFLYGDFINLLVSFVVIAAVIYFFVVVPYTALLARMKKEPPSDPTTKNCPECLTEIPIAAKRCSACAQPQPA
ncbi:MAG: large conductance mechanosensitive channel protein MscL [Candidatus Dormibacterales bacterium]